MRSKLLLLMMVSLLLTACTLPAALTSLLDRIRPQPTPLPESNSLLDLVANGKVNVVSIRGNTGLDNFTGRTIDLELYNNTQFPLEVEIPCGLVFVSADENTSRMMVVQPSVANLTMGETDIVKPFVLSVDSLKSLPAAEKTYRVEELEAGKQLQYAQCLCKVDLPAETETQELISLQLAAWMIDSEGVFTTLPESLNNLLKDITGLPIAIPGLGETMQDLAGNLAPNAQVWLDRCGIELGE